MLNYINVDDTDWTQLICIHDAYSFKCILTTMVKEKEALIWKGGAEMEGI